LKIIHRLEKFEKKINERWRKSKNTTTQFKSKHKTKNVEK